MRIRCLIILFSILAIFANVYGQSVMRGRVTATSGQPLPAASVTLIESNVHTLTDDQGRFELKNLPGNLTLDISYTGYDQRTVAFNSDSLHNKVLEINLQRSGTSLEEVNVSGVKKKSATATRTLLQIMDIPQSIVVMGQKVIKEQGAFDLTTITRNISGLNYTGSYGGSGSYQFFNARGFDLSNSQNYRWNGQMIWNLGNNYADNIEQVEFLKGPTSILFGDVSPGGVLNFVSKKPLHEFALNVDMKIGQWGLIRPAVDFNTPLNSSGSLRFRLNTSYEQSNSFRDFVKEKRFLLAPTIAWDITSKISLTAEAVFRNSTSTDDAGLVSPDGTVAGLNKLSPHLYLGEPSRNYLYNDQSYFLTFNYNILPAWRLRLVSFYGNTNNRPFGIWPGQPDSAGNLERSQYGYYQKLNNFSTSIDLMGTFFTGNIKHSVVIGMDFQSTHYRYSTDGSLSFFDSFNIYKPVYGVTPGIPPTENYLPFVSILERTGIYAQDQIMFFKEKLHLLLGLRAGRTRQGNHYYQDQLPGTDYEGYTDDIVSKTVWTPRVGIVYKPVTNLSLYASWSKGYEINSPDIFALNYLQYLNPPPTLSTQFEFGAKANVLHDALGISLCFFRIDKQDPYGYTYVLDSLGNVDYDHYNIYYSGHHRSEGIELDIDGKLSKTLSLTAGAAYTNAKVIEDPGYPSGNVLPNAPKWSGNAWLNYNAIGKLHGLTLGAGIFYKGEFYSTIANDPAQLIPSNYTIDVSAGYHYKEFGIQLNISNLTNRISYLNPWAFVIYDVQPLRRAVVSLTYQFAKRNKK